MIHLSLGRYNFTPPIFINFLKERGGGVQNNFYNLFTLYFSISSGDKLEKNLDLLPTPDHV